MESRKRPLKIHPRVKIKFVILILPCLCAIVVLHECVPRANTL